MGIVTLPGRRRDLYVWREACCMPGPMLDASFALAPVACAVIARAFPKTCNYELKHGRASVYRGISNVFRRAAGKCSRWRSTGERTAVEILDRIVGMGASATLCHFCALPIGDRQHPTTIGRVVTTACSRVPRPKTHQHPEQPTLSLGAAFISGEIALPRMDGIERAIPWSATLVWPFQNLTVRSDGQRNLVGGPMP
jgi:hypothetical protein